MTAMPDPLREWTPELERLTDASQAAFADWLPRLSVAFGPFVNLRAVESGEPEGFDGLTHKGRYDRLLLSEWLLADEAPLEFMRRAAAGEHLFHNLARKQPAQSRCCLVLLDAGPLQLGTPRLAQLALLIVLARRAREASARLVWGIVQQPGVIHEGFDEPGVRGWLAARTWTPVASEQLVLWREHLKWIDLDPDERWLISDRELEPLARASGLVSTVWIREPLATAAQDYAQTLEIEIHDGLRSKPRRSLGLPLPSDAIAAQILRDPLRAPPRRSLPRPQNSSRPGVSKLERNCWKGRPPEGIWTDTYGRRLFAQRPNGAVLGFHLPSSVHERFGRPRKFTPPDADVLALQARGKRLFAVLRTDTELILSNFAKSEQTRVHTLGAGSELAELTVPWHGPHNARLIQDQRGYLLHTATGALVRLTAQNEHTLGVRVLATEVRAMIEHNGTLLIATDDVEGPRIHVLSVRDELVPLLRNQSFRGLVFVGFGFNRLVSEIPSILLQDESGEHRMFACSQWLEAPRMEAGETVIAPYCVAVGPAQTPSSVLLVLDATRQRIVLRTHERTILQAKFESEISSTTLSHHRGLIAAWTTSNRLWVHDLIKSQTLLNHQFVGRSEPLP